MGLLPIGPHSVGWIEGILSAWLLLLGGLYAWTARRRVGRAPAANLVFALALACALSALHLPAPFQALSTALVEATGLPALLRDADARIHAIESLPGDIVDTLRGPFAEGGEESEADSPAPDSLALGARVLPLLEGMVTGLLRWTCFALCLLALLASFLLRRGEFLSSELRALRLRVAALERERGALGRAATQTREIAEAARDPGPSREDSEASPR
jgi:hypothetical protein